MSEHIKQRYRKSVTLSQKSYELLEDMFDTQKQSGVFLTIVVEQAIFQLHKEKDIQIKINIDLLNLKY